jgi:putative glutamine amidotransferase
MKPIIGVTPDFNAGDREDMGGREPTYFLRARYIRAIEELGGVPVILPLVADRRARQSLLSAIHGLLLTGSGPDLHPSHYGERQKYPFKVMAPRRAAFDLDLARSAARSGVPVLGICGGMQTMNVACGGSLFQDIPSQTDHSLAHRQSEPATRLSHSVSIVPNSILGRIVKQRTMRVNSSHHQSVKQAAPGLMVSALAPDGIIEAIESPTHRFFIGLQWHPEFLFDRYPVHRRLFQAFLTAARRAS